MPDRDGEVENDERHRRARKKVRDRSDVSPRQNGAQHPPWCAGEEQWWHRQRQQQVLHHMRTEQIIVAEVVDRTVERCKHHQQPRHEIDLLTKGRLASEDRKSTRLNPSHVSISYAV